MHWRILRALLLAASLQLGGCIGWASMTLPPAPTTGQWELIRSTHFSATVGVAVDRGKHATLRDLLRATGLFDRVELITDIERPELIARVRGGASHANPLPFVTMLTLGVVPIFAKDEWGEVFSLQASNDPFVPPDMRNPHRGPDPPELHTIRVDSRYEGSLHMGWIAILTGLWPGRTLFRPDWSSSYIDSLRAHLCDQAPAIDALIRRARR